MADRYAGFLVILDDDIRVDESEGIVTALHWIRGVARVEPVPTTRDIAARVVDERTREAWRALLVKMLADLDAGRVPR